jgi:ribosomal protein S18 acetylase RimI-like enzyme
MSSATAQAAGPKSTLEIVDLQRITGRELDPLLLEETVEWERELDWDFSQSAELVRRYTDSRSLAGAALLDRGEVAGYCYAVLEDQRALIGDLYVRPAWREGDAQLRLFRTILDGLTGVAGLRRVESQLMMIDPAVGQALSRERAIEVRERVLMASSCEDPGSCGDTGPGPDSRFQIRSWEDHYEEQAATVIALAYGDHVDSEINEQYRTVAGARRFLHNIVRYPGCGMFFKPASMVAFDRQTGWVAGIVLVSFVAPQTGHVTQLCVTPQSQGSGLGRELLRRAMHALYLNGAKRVTLTVTGANEPALELYRRSGFREMRSFLAYVWESSAK